LTLPRALRKSILRSTSKERNSSLRVCKVMNLKLSIPPRRGKRTRMLTKWKMIMMKRRKAKMAKMKKSRRSGVENLSHSTYSNKWSRKSWQRNKWIRKRRRCKKQRMKRKSFLEDTSISNMPCSTTSKVTQKRCQTTLKKKKGL
jgi:hypothetical protein